MSVDGETTKTGASEGKVTPSVQLSECSAACNSLSIMAEVSLGAAARSEVAAPYPAQAGLVLPNRTGSTDTCSNSEGAEKKAAQNESHINRRNSLHPSKQQQRLSKRRNTSNYGFKHSTSGKRRRRANSESDSVLPSNFLLGGNIFDPLNLNSLLDEEVNRALNAETPKSSPLPAKSRDPVEILIPRDITDPLNLNSGIADSSFLVYPLKSGGRRRNRNRHHGCGGGGAGGGGGGGLSASHPNLTEAGKGGEVKTSGSALKPGALSSCSVPDVPGEPAALSGVGGGEAHDSKDADSAGCREEATVSASGQTRSAEDITSPAPNQHSGRRRRRRNSSKMEPAAAQCVSVRKHVPAERGPGTGPRAGQGARQPQQSYNHQSYNQHKQQQSRKFQYGNYNQYYGYRNPGTNEDPRISVLRPEWFQGKDVLDLGCNSGHLTLYIAKVLRPARILGLDIDSGLVHAARKNIRHYLSALQTEEARRTTQGGKSTEGEERDGNQQLVAAADKQDKHKQAESRDENGEHAKGVSNPSETPKDNVSCRVEDADTRERDDTTEKSVPDGCGVLPADCSFPVSLRITRGPIAAPPLTEKPAPAPGEFPSNVSFIKANYVLESDELLLTQRPEYDVILCLSVTKWVHLNWGDRGLKRLFQRVYRHLRPGGIFILEPQPWESYARRKKLTDSISKNFNSICLKPEQFSTYLTNKVGFSSYEFIATPKSSMKGFQRPIYLYHK